MTWNPGNPDLDRTKPLRPAQGPFDDRGFHHGGDLQRLRQGLCRRG